MLSKYAFFVTPNDTLLIVCCLLFVVRTYPKVAAKIFHNRKVNSDSSWLHQRSPLSVQCEARGAYENQKKFGVSDILDVYAPDYADEQPNPVGCRVNALSYCVFTTSDDQELELVKNELDRNGMNECCIVLMNERFTEVIKSYCDDHDCLALGLTCASLYSVCFGAQDLNYYYVKFAQSNLDYAARKKLLLRCVDERKLLKSIFTDVRVWNGMFAELELFVEILKSEATEPAAIEPASLSGLLQGVWELAIGISCCCRFVDLACYRSVNRAFLINFDKAEVVSQCGDQGHLHLRISSAMWQCMDKTVACMWRFSGATHIEIDVNSDSMDKHSLRRTYKFNGKFLYCLEGTCAPFNYEKLRLKRLKYVRIDSGRWNRNKKRRMAMSPTWYALQHQLQEEKVNPEMIHVFGNNLQQLNVLLPSQCMVLDRSRVNGAFFSRILHSTNVDDLSCYFSKFVGTNQNDNYISPCTTNVSFAFCDGFDALKGDEMGNISILHSGRYINDSLVNFVVDVLMSGRCMNDRQFSLMIYDGWCNGYGFTKNNLKKLADFVMGIVPNISQFQKIEFGMLIFNGAAHIVDSDGTAQDNNNMEDKPQLINSSDHIGYLWDLKATDRNEWRQKFVEMQLLVDGKIFTSREEAFNHAKIMMNAWPKMIESRFIMMD